MIFLFYHITFTLKTLASVNINGIKSIIKQSSLCDFIRKYDLDLIFLQEINTDTFSVPLGYDFISNVGPNERGTAIIFRIGYEIKNIMCEADGKILSATINNINFVNIYAPSGSQSYHERNNFYQNQITKHLNFDSPIIWIGDFNCIIKNKDSRNPTQLCKILSRIIESLRFEDMWEIVNGEQVEFTYFRENCASRIDRAYITREHKKLVHSIKTCPLSFTDHNALILCIKEGSSFSHCRHNYGYWKMKPSLLSNENIEMFRAEIFKLKQNSLYHCDFVKWWFNVLKKRAKNFFKGLEIQKAIENKERRLFYENVLFELKNKLNRGENVLERFREVKEILIQLKEKYLSEKINNVNKEIVDERHGLYEYVRQRRKTKPGSISELVAEDGRKIGNTKDILEYARINVAKKFDKGNVSDKELRCLLAHVKDNIGVQDRKKLTEIISKEEVYTSLLKTYKKKTPGIDGLTYEFYLKFFGEIGDDLTRLFNTLISGDVKPPELFAEGVIILVDKGKNSKNLENYRSITLLNSDYKIFMKILAERCKSMSEKFLSKFQTCGNNYSIFNNLMLIRDTILKFESDKKAGGALLALDFQQAFDRVDHDYLWKIMEKIGFHAQFINTLKNIYAIASSRIQVNGFLSRTFKIKTSVRQGCPLSMLLFAVYLDPFIRLCNFSLKGLQIGQCTYKINAYADDVVIFVGEINDFKTVSKIIKVFEGGSNAKVNVNKSSVLPLGKWKNWQLEEHANDFQIKNELKILGIRITNNFRETLKLNWETVAKNIGNNIFALALRNLNLIQRIWYVNVYMLAKIWYLAQVLPMNNIYSQKIVKLIGNFIWRGHLYRVERLQLYLPVNQGGLGLINIDLKTKALFIKTQYRSVLDDDRQFYYKSSLNFLFDRVPYATPAQFKGITSAITDIDVDDLQNVTAKKLYSNMLKKMQIKPKIESKYSQLNWKKIWTCLTNQSIPSLWKSAVYKAINDVYTTGDKAKRHGLAVSGRCLRCDGDDSLMHRLKHCPEKRESWLWLDSILQKNFNVSIGSCVDFRHLLWHKFETQEDINTWQWYIAAILYCNLEKSGNKEELIGLLRGDRYERLSYYSGKILGLSNKIFGF